MYDCINFTIHLVVHNDTSLGDHQLASKERIDRAGDRNHKPTPVRRNCCRSPAISQHPIPIWIIGRRIQCMDFLDIAFNFFSCLLRVHSLLVIREIWRERGYSEEGSLAVSKSHSFIQEMSTEVSWEGVDMS
jgi:hypothetical protein